MKNQNSLLKRDGVSYMIPFILVTSLFFFWGLANNMTDTLLSAFRKIMNMTSLETSFIQMAFYGSYFCFALPAALFIRKFSYQAGIILGILLFTLGGLLFYPAGLSASYTFYLIAIYIMAGGCSVLETTANPFILSMGSDDTATRRLNLAQSFNPIGSISGLLISQTFILSQLASEDSRSLMTEAELLANQSKELFAVSAPYMAVGVVLLSVLVIMAFYKIPSAQDNDKSKVGEVFGRLIKNKHYAFGVIAQFFYVGAQICVWSFLIQYVSQEMGWEPDVAAYVYIISMVCFVFARFIFTYLMKFFSPAKLLLVAAIMALISTVGVILGNGYFALSAMISISFFMSLMFPTIYGIALHGLKSDAKIGASGLIMAILGGAVLTTVQGGVATFMSTETNGVLLENYHLSYIIPAICFCVVIAYALFDIRYSRLK